MTTSTVGQMATSEGELTRVQDEQDPYTHALLASFDLPADARCLELGAGQGSIAAWMADRFGPSQVTAVDRDTSRLDDLARIGVEVLTTDISAYDAGPGTFDLIHARAVLTHLPERERVVASAVTWLKPGGYLLVADPADFPVASSPYPEVRRMAHALTDMATRWGTDTGWARRYPRQLIDAGLEDTDAECRLRMMRGGTREAMMLVDLYQRARPALVGAGVTEDEVDAVLALLQSPTYVDLPPAVIRALGPQTPGQRTLGFRVSAKPTSRLLQLKPGGTLLAVDAPPDYLDMLGPLPNGARLVEDFSANPDVVHLFVRSAEKLGPALASVLQATRPDAIVWVSYPKTATKQARAGLSRQDVHNEFRRLGYKPVAQFSVDETWSAIRGRSA